MNKEQLETHLTDIQRQIQKLFERRGIDPLHLMHFVVYCTTEKVYQMLFDEVEELELEEWIDVRNELLFEIERAFTDASKLELKKRRIL